MPEAGANTAASDGAALHALGAAPCSGAGGASRRGADARPRTACRRLGSMWKVTRETRPRSTIWAEAAEMSSEG